MKSVMAHSFAQVPKAEIQRSAFDRSHGYKTTFDAGYLVPIFVDEALPGDTFNLQMSAFARLSSATFRPIMDNMFLDSFFFAVPIRLIWENWERFNGAQDDPGDPTDYEVPQVQMPAVTGAAVGSLADYFGIPTGKADLLVNSLHFRAYNLIWNTWFRDQNLQDSVVVDRDDGPDTYTDYTLLRRGKRHDYFTACLPEPQKGDAVSMPLGTTAPVYPSGAPIALKGTLNTTPKNVLFPGSGTNMDWSAASQGGPENAVWHDAGLYTDLSGATAATVNALRQAVQLQRLYERDARGGTRYTEIIRSHFGVVSPDARLQRPEYLGGGSSPVNVHPVSQTAMGNWASTAYSPGNQWGFGTVSAIGHGFTKSFVEHCVIIGLVSVRADLTYQQGLNRMWSRRTRWDYYWPALAHLGEQAVLNKEIFTQVNSADDEVFGYQERFAEYRYKPSQITGKFRSDASGTLDVWHLSQDFAALPELNDSFIVDDPPVDRAITVPTEPQFLYDSYIKLKCARPMPLFGVPGFLDRF